MIQLKEKKFIKYCIFNHLLNTFTFVAHQKTIDAFLMLKFQANIFLSGPKLAIKLAKSALLDHLFGGVVTFCLLALFWTRLMSY